MTLRTLLSLCIAVGMHSSLCTGGFFAITAAIAYEAAYVQEEETGPMSYGAIGYLSCKSESKDRDISASADAGCKDAKACMTRVSSALKNKLFVASNLMFELPIALFALDVPEPHILPMSAYARAGPLYESAPSLAHSLRKLE